MSYLVVLFSAYPRMVQSRQSVRGGWRMCGEEGAGQQLRKATMARIDATHVLQCYGVVYMRSGHPYPAESSGY